MRSAERPAPRADAVMATLGSEVVLFGGRGASGALDDVWVWDDGWTQRTPAGGLTGALAWPAPRYGATMATHAPTNSLVLFGGEDGSVQFGDTWTWDVTGWTLRQLTGQGPAARADAASAAFADSRGVVLHGGRSGDYPRTDTWAWDGTTWLPKPVPTSPPLRSAHAMALSRASQPDQARVVLFGGCGAPAAAGDCFNDIWSWNSTNWRDITVGGEPPARGDHVLASSGADDLLLFGGTDGQTLLGDTWTYTGGSWTAHTGDGPPARRGATAARLADGRVLLFGGHGAKGLLADTWLWNGTSWRKLP